MDGFSGYNQIQIRPEDQHKTAFICPWGTRKMLFGLKKAGATFQRAMSYAFNDINKIVEAQLKEEYWTTTSSEGDPEMEYVFSSTTEEQDDADGSRLESFCLWVGPLETKETLICN